MKEKMNVTEFGCNDILSEMEKIQVFGGGIGGNGGDNISCANHQCEFNDGCSNSGCGSDSGCVNLGCVHYSKCGEGPKPIELYGEC